MRFYAQTRCSLGEISKNPSWKLENMVSTISKTISMQICNFFTMADVFLGKVTITASVKKSNFPNISEQAPLMFLNNYHQA